MELRNPEKTYEMARDWYRNTPYCLLAMRHLKSKFPNMEFIGHRRLTPYMETGVLVHCVDSTAEYDDIERIIQEVVPAYTLDAGDRGKFPICFEKVGELPAEDSDSEFLITELCNG